MDKSGDVQKTSRSDRLLDEDAQIAQALQDEMFMRELINHQPW